MNVERRANMRRRIAAGMACLGVAVTTGLSAGGVTEAGSAPASFRPLLLFMQPEDARDTRGVLAFEANPLQVKGQITLAETVASGSADGARLASFRPLLAVSDEDGSYCVFACAHEEAGTSPMTFRWRLYRGVTRDGHRLTEWREVFRNPDGPWLIESAMVYQATAGRYYFYTWSRDPEPGKGHAMWGFSSADGFAWEPLSTNALYHDHDAFGGMYDSRASRFVMAQVTYQAWKKPYADNLGSDRRRVLSMCVSRDGTHWQRAGDGGTADLITPDNEDPPDIEFYRMQPFPYGDRYLGVANLYAASPLTPGEHGPHLTCEWWASDDGLRWKRPWRGVDAHGEAAYAIKMAPMWFGNEMLFWVSGEVLGLPAYRVASIASRSNAEFSSRAFDMPAQPLSLNASVPAGKGLFNQAYVAVALQDEAGRAIPGYEHEQCVLRAVDDVRIPLQWGPRTGEELAGRKVVLRFHLRFARIYAVGF